MNRENLIFSIERTSEGRLWALIPRLGVNEELNIDRVHSSLHNYS